ncbi:MAG: PRC-barrel domain containing protein [Pedobacter sp.]|uniref:PRC-barrel domain-containing protein n=1 Tax=Pedobacter agri TaxID=454586 RepID=UPI00120F6A5A|nr:PRC-barrel domain-containing protein [Pedobacter agri]RZL31101.1 MAG: PRC-barrel domain containing protein [Pedobacter sp.]
MENQGNTYSELQELSNSDYKLTAGEADIKGWTVQNESETQIGKVRDLLFDPINNAVRYLIIDLDDLGVDMESKGVIIPIGLAHLHEREDIVILPNIHTDQFKALPYYVSGEVDQNVENEIRTIIGSPAALRLEEKIVELDVAEFYNHHHFDKAQFYNRDRKIHL